MTIVCITNDIPDIRSCTIRGEHAAICDGWEYRWNVDTRRDEATGRDCGGCLPRPARHGLVCWRCWESILTAVDRFPPGAHAARGRACGAA